MDGSTIELELNTLAEQCASHFNAGRQYDADVAFSYMMLLADDDYVYVSDILNEYLHNH